ncbi:HD domain-containing protein [Bradyrhizobium liaoningense]|uniref:HD domain-containing protein n=1 Tax=Bradyrhizobium liaoningense TaxID=43992 RepID=UPI001BA66CCD|nr:HD domain-containing protein [Bradyrhizobium liaoningense]MBR0907827.1 HD domain-containing protein [Bradyrhizobium liaoningense]
MQLRTIFASIASAMVLAQTAVPSEAEAVRPVVAQAPSNRGEIAGIKVPSGKLAIGAAQLVRQTEDDLLFEHSMRVYYWAALAGKRKGLFFDPELLFVAAMFHDYGLTVGYGESHLRYEVDGANAAREFLLSQGVSEGDRQKVWLAIALHTTNGISPHLHPIASLLAEAANMDLVGAGFEDFSAEQRSAVEAAYPRPPQFADGFLQALYNSLKHRPETTQGTGLADVLAYKDPNFHRRDFSSLMRTSRWVIGH